MPTLTSIRTNVYNKLLTITGDNLQLRSTYKHRSNNPSGWPSAMMYAIKSESEALTNRDNLRKVTISIAVAIGIPDNPDAKSEEQAEVRLDSAIDAVIDLFENDITLGETVDWINPTITEDRSIEEFSNGKALVQFLAIELVYSVSLTF